jgi:hypothetical protein
MRVMVFVKATEASEGGIPPTAEAFAAMDRFNADLAEAGVLLAAAGLKPTAQAKRVAFDGADRTVIDGPFPDIGAQVAGFWIWEVADVAEAVAWARRCPNPMPGPSQVEIRPFYEAADLAALVTADERASPPAGLRGTRGAA